MTALDAQGRSQVPRRGGFAQALRLAPLLLAACASGGTVDATGASDAGGDASIDAGGDDAGLQLDAPALEDADASPFTGCATATSEAHLVPLDLYVMLDQSGSMVGPKWTNVTTALTDFAGVASSGIGMGLQYFPLSGAKVCDYSAYETPEVPIAALPAGKKAITDSLATHVPTGETPTLPAIQGALSYAATYAAANPTHVVAVVLATDGEPNICGSTAANVAQAAGLAAKGTPKIRTFVIGVGKSLTTLDPIAVAGDTAHAYLVDDSAAAGSQGFVDALQAIRGTAVACEYLIPVSPAGTIDFDRVNVVRSSPSFAPSPLGKVADASACGAKGGWYYDDPAAPTAVKLCPAECDATRADTSARIDVVFGCKTLIQ